MSTNTLADIGNQLKAQFGTDGIIPDGTYQLKSDNTIEDYAAKWSYGFIVGVHALRFEDLYPGRLFGVWTDPDDGQLYIDAVIHVDSRLDAERLGKVYDQKAVFDLRTREVVYV